MAQEGTRGKEILRYKKIFNLFVLYIFDTKRCLAFNSIEHPSPPTFCLNEFFIALSIVQTITSFILNVSYCNS